VSFAKSHAVLLKAQKSKVYKRLTSAERCILYFAVALEKKNILGALFLLRWPQWFRKPVSTVCWPYVRQSQNSILEKNGNLMAGYC